MNTKIVKPHLPRNSGITAASNEKIKYEENKIKTSVSGLKSIVFY